MKKGLILGVGAAAAIGVATIIGLNIKNNDANEIDTTEVVETINETETADYNVFENYESTFNMLTEVDVESGTVYYSEINDGNILVDIEYNSDDAGVYIKTYSANTNGGVESVANELLTKIERSGVENAYTISAGSYIDRKYYVMLQYDCDPLGEGSLSCERVSIAAVSEDGTIEKIADLNQWWTTDEGDMEFKQARQNDLTQIFNQEFSKDQVKTIADGDGVVSDYLDGIEKVYSF